MTIKTYQILNFILHVLRIFFVLLLTIIYAILIKNYPGYMVYILVFFALAILAIFYVGDWLFALLEKKVIGSKIIIAKPILPTKKLPEKIYLGNSYKRTHHTLYRHQGMSVPDCFIAHVRGEFGYLYPHVTQKALEEKSYTILANYKFKFFLIQDEEALCYLVYYKHIA